ncbi:MAG TPA: DnaA N-terminal domain-containing protein, partial [Hyphomicrobiales bacterium]|nr:DnaA N-terminal domain-containing protein [Hyphomicrobiales bacterium]
MTEEIFGMRENDNQAQTIKAPVAATAHSTDICDGPEGEGELVATWHRVRNRLRVELGEDVYSSWFARVTPEAMSDKTVHLSVPTRFLKSWISSHYSDRLLSLWQGEDPQVARLQLTVRGPALASAARSRNGAGATPGCASTGPADPLAQGAEGVASEAEA